MCTITSPFYSICISFTQRLSISVVRQNYTYPRYIDAIDTGLLPCLRKERWLKQSRKLRKVSRSHLKTLITGLYGELFSDTMVTIVQLVINS